MGLMYDKGEGVTQDYKEAGKWYRLAAEERVATAQFQLGLMYERGQGVTQDYKEAEKWFRLSAEQEIAQAQFNMGGIYYIGQGVPRDQVLAYIWMNIASSNGNKNAIQFRNLLEKKMSPQQIEEAQRLTRNWKPKK